jgi:hypothetical protein
VFIKKKVVVQGWFPFYPNELQAHLEIVMVDPREVEMVVVVVVGHPLILHLE